MSRQEGGDDGVSQLVTGEAVVLQVRIARMPTRALACAIDVILQGVVLGVLISLLTGFLIGGEASEALAVALIFLVVLVVVVGYRVVMETLTRGRTLGKMVLGLKVVRDDGSSIRFRHALVRTLMWFFVDFAPWFAACPGIVASLMNKQGKRIGDMVAGTVVIRERHQPMASPPLFVPGHLVQWAQSLELSRLSDELANASREYLARYTELLPGARDSIGDALAYRVSQVTAPVPPVPMVAPAFLSAVLAERRRRELNRLAVPRAAVNTGPFGPYAVPAGPFAATPSPYGALPPPPVPGPFPAPAPAAPYRPAAVNPQGWAAPGSNESGQWF
ncbi:RDD family protein [Kribbella sp. NPDC050124]|uniref:RDD family protein n=1 Tax=Kribbella sp. NPDC050124 TaxID=3364114 RepID=UPI003790F211